MRKNFSKGTMPARNKKNFRPTKSGAGMTRAGVKAYRRLNPGSKLKTAVKWVDIGAPKKDGKYQPCGRQKGSKRKYPKCVPLAKATRMTKSQKASAVRRKRAAGNPGGKPTNVATFAKRKRMAFGGRV